MGSGAPAGRRRWLLFTSVVLCCVAACRGSVHTSQSEVRVPENSPATLSCSYTGYASPRVEWKYTHGDVTGLVYYNGKITASYADRVHFMPSGIAFTKATRKDSGRYTCMVTDEDGNTYGEANIQLIVLVPPSKPVANVPSSATIGNRAVLTCSEKEGSPPPEFFWFKDGVPIPSNPKANRAFSNSSYTINEKTGELVFEPVTAFDSGDYVCEARNGVGPPVRSEMVRMEAAELNVGGIVAAVLVTLILLGLLVFGIWFAYSRGYFDRAKKGTPGKKVIYSQPSARSQGEFRQTSSFLV
ncbi:junctional adhesion molecule A [Sorex araneus]|uniref:junctional adhesion molecule A n=1 Tax=Sorex araneus TaxID=42254 RepID=UPI0003317DEC|nr:junctional adhesion molecule A [Sorex araneus]